MYYGARMSTVINEVKTEVKSKRAKKPKVEKVEKPKVEKPKVEKVEKVKKPKVEKVEKPKIVKTKVDKYNGFKVPDKKIPSTRWANHVYDIIKEARLELLQQEDVRTAYNNLVECLRKYDGLLASYIPSKYSKYNSGIDFDYVANGVAVFNCRPFRWLAEHDYTNHKSNEQRDQNIKKKIEFIVELEKVYTPLFDLIKRDVIPYMELKQHEINSKYTIQRLHYQMEKVERSIKMYESRITDLYKEMGKLSEEVIKSKEPPKLTVFE